MLYELLLIARVSKKHKISVNTVNNITKGLKKKNEQLIQEKIEVIQSSRALTEHEMNAVERSVQ